ncbi:WD40 repeat-like protein [Cucurbitaria berberidis CBS 394.84]|uniref:WD40 repeat-like protein n=1 Tax=Cucurbitaria berberidis CBS 394.84 TaxID=1168544 RepID=A0A9P4GRB9_9PLEO|nr:WD40 repeat-like protein [Cucurbitaria berberidis CBS 394.84]KAF1849686.1 WD40 repeat-like protein [Cucurbitaria berberidis CBS 394.84]
MAPHCISSRDFLKQFSFPIEPARDFELDGIPASYAAGHPREWGRETDVLDFTRTKEKDERAYKSYSTAISPDQKLLAITTSKGPILIYDVKSKELRQVLEGSGALVFRPIVKKGEQADTIAEDAGGEHEKPAYTAVSGIPEKASRRGSEDDQLILWHLDQHGRALDEEEPILPAIFATTAIDAIAPELTANHGWTREFVNASTLHARFAEALRQVAADHRRRNNTIIDNATLSNFSSTAFSSDGRLLLYHFQNGSTQSGMREQDKLPQVVIYDIDARMEIHRLSGHTDAIMWSGISPDNQYVASVSWDGTMRMYSSTTGKLGWATEDSGGQSWAGAFSSDSKHIVWSSKSGRVIQVHDVVDGRKISTFQETFNDWCRCLQWHPIKSQIALCVGTHAYVWSPFEGQNGSTIQHFAMGDEKDWNSMAGVQAVSWLDEGRLLCLEISDGTKLVYDTQSNTKELFRRPMGVNIAWVERGFYNLFQKEGESSLYISIDGDGKVRYW